MSVKQWNEKHKHRVSVYYADGTHGVWRFKNRAEASKELHDLEKKKTIRGFTHLGESKPKKRVTHNNGFGGLAGSLFR